MNPIYFLIGVFFLLLFLALLLAPFYLVFQLYLNLATKIKPRLTIRGVIRFTVLWFFLTFILIPVFLWTRPPFSDVAPVLFFGWIVGFWRFFSGFRFEPVAVFVGLVSLTLFVLTLHVLLRGILKRYGKSWRRSQTACVAGIILAVCVSGIALLAGIHEIYWAMTSGEAWVNGGGRIAARRLQTTNDVKQIAFGVHNYHAPKSLLPSGTILSDGRLGHSWETQLLPYMEYPELYQKIQLDKPWHDPDNRPVFEEILRPFRSLMVSEEKHRNAAGYGLSFYAVNERVLPVGERRSFEQITDGTSNTILLGEVKGNVRAWGDPVNGRDPALGINQSPYGFGGYFPGGAVMGFCDGSVQFLGDTTSPEVMRALATPDGGEKDVVIP